MCQHTLFDLKGAEIHKYERSKQCRRCRRYSTDFKALNAMYVKDIKDGVSSFYTTLHTKYCYSSHSCWRCQRYYCTLYTGPLTPPGRKAIYLSLPPCGFSGSPPVSLRRLSWTWQLQGWLQARYTANPQFLNAMGVLSNPVILTYLQPSCILHTLTNCLPVLNFDQKSVFSAWWPWACIIPLEVAGSVSGKVRSHEQVDVPIHRLQHQMLGCQVTQTHLSLIAHTWPWFYPSRSCTPCLPPA